MQTTAPDLPLEFVLYHQSQSTLVVVNRLLGERVEYMGAMTNKWLDYGAQLRVVARKLQARTTRRERAWNALFTKGN